jgi:hypothetical protein
MNERGPVIDELARQWMDGEIDCGTYWDECLARERPHAELQVEKALEKRRLERLELQKEQVIESEITAHGLMHSLFQRVIKRP